MTKVLFQQALDALLECRYATTDKSESLADAAIAALSEAIAQPVQPAITEVKGWQLARIEPTREMEDAAIRDLGWSPEDVAAAKIDDNERICLRVTYRAMLSAAPTPHSQIAAPVAQAEPDDDLTIAYMCGFEKGKEHHRAK